MKTPLNPGRRWPRLAAAVLALAAGAAPLAFGTTAHASQTPAVPKGVQAATAGNDGTADIVWKGSDGYLYQASGATDAGSFAGPVKRANMGTAASDPAIAVDKAGDTFVYWQNGRNLYEDYWVSGSGWSGAKNLGMGDLASKPGVAVGPGGGTAWVFWKGVNGDLYEASGSPKGSLGSPVDRDMGPLNSAPTVGINSSLSTYIYWMGSNQDIEEGYWNGSGWTGPVQRQPAGTTLTGPSVVVTTAGVAHLFWEGDSDQQFYESTGNANGIQGGPIQRPEMETLSSAVSAGNSTANWPAAFWIDADGGLREGYYDGSGWTGQYYHYEVGALAGPPSVAIYGP